MATCREFIGKAHFDMAYARVHLKPVILLFLPQIAISLYVTLDGPDAGGTCFYKGCRDLRPSLKTRKYFVDLSHLTGKRYVAPCIEPLVVGRHKAVNKMHQNVLFGL